MIKLLSGDLEKIRQSNDRQLRKSDSSKKTKHESINSNVRLNDLAKSSFYMSLDKQYEKKIFTFAELVKIKAKQHFKGTANFFGSSVFGLSFK